MAERKFTRGLSKLGSAALVRESVSEVVRITTVLAKPLLVEPLDYETFVTKNRTAIENDPCKEMLLFPTDDIYQSTIPRRSRTLLPSSSFPQATPEITNLFVLECLRTYATCWHLVHYKYGSYSGGYSQLPKLHKTEYLEDLLYEMDALNDERELQQLQRHSGVVKEGYLMEKTDLSSEGFRSCSAKSFRRKFACIRKEEDGRFLFEFYNDEKKIERKFLICLNFCIDVVKNPKRGKFVFELTMQEEKRYVLSAENDFDLEEWIKSIKGVIQYCCQVINNEAESREKFVAVSQNRTVLNSSEARTSELAKYAKETVMSIAAARKESRQNLFAVYPDITTVPDVIYAEEIEAEPYKEQFGARVFVKCESLKFELQMPSENDSRTLSQVEPYVTTLSLFNAKAGKKVSADFKFDVNCKSTRKMMTSQHMRKCYSETNGDTSNGGPAERRSILGTCYPDGFDTWLTYPNQALFNISEPDPDIYLVVRVEKVLQGSISQAVDPYLRGSRNGDLRTGCKVNKNARASCLRLGNYFMPFAWTAKPLFRDNGREIDTYPYCNTIYKQEGCHLSNENLMKYLAEWKKPDKKFRLVNIPGSFKMTVEPYLTNIDNCVSPSLAPVSPFPWPPTNEPTFEVDNFPIHDGSNSHPFVNYANRLYIYPKYLQFDNQKSFTKARNIACIIEFRDSDEEGAVPLKCIYGKPGESVLVNQSRCAVTHHSTIPNFYEEVKFEMPLQLNEKHHILFMFRHITCEIPKGSKKKDQPLEIPIGYAWLPLYCSERIVVKDHILPVSENLPYGYLSSKYLGSDKKVGTGTLDVRWVDGGRPLFKLEMKLISTVYSMDQHLNNFFLHVHKLVDSKYTISVAESSKNIKALHAMDTVTLTKFLPTILNQLFRLLVSPISDGVALDIVKVLIHIVNTIQEEGKIKFLKAYVKYIFVTEPEMGDDKLTVHEELTKSIIKTLRPANADFIVINKFLRNSWFFFQTIIKSMAQHLLNSGKMKLHRHERFSADFQFRIQNLTQVLIPHITQKFKDFPEETRRANRSLGHFIKKCLNLMDRGFVFKLINFYVDKFNLGDPKTLQEYKFEFLQIILSHEHYIALNLPTIQQEIGSVRNSTADFSLEHEFKLSRDFCQKHFLVGLLLQEVKVALNEVKDVRRIAVAVLMNILAKHSFDDRLQTKIQQARISTLYLPFITVILENLNRLNFPDNANPSTNFNETYDGSIVSMQDLNGSLSSGASVSLGSESSKSQSFDIGGDLLSRGGTTPSYHEKQHKRDSSYLSVIAGQAILGQGTSLVDSASLSNSSSTLSASSQPDMDSQENDCETNSVGHSRNDSIRTPPLSMRYDKLMPFEVKDILICFLYIIKNITEELLIGWWQHFGDSSIIDFFHIIELCLHHFRYLGKKHILHSGKSHIQNDVNPKSLTLPARVSPPGLSNGSSRTLSTCSEGIDLHNNPEVLKRALLEANIATEVGLIVLDVLGVFCVHFKDKLLLNEGDNPMMKKVFDIYIFFLQIGQSEKLLKHVFAAMRAFVLQFPSVLYDGDTMFCGTLCYEILKCCSSHLLTTRNEACALLYLLMGGNYTAMRSKGLTRVHLQVIISVSRLQGDFVRLNNGRFQESLSVLNNYAENDDAMQSTSFPSQVMDLTKRINTILMATMQMHKHEYDPEMLIDLQHSLANSYAATYELRKTWLQNMAKLHVSNENFSEAAFCHIHIAALIAECLKQKGIFQRGCEAFTNISPNILKDEKCAKEDAKIQDMFYTEDCLVDTLAQCAEMLEKAERYELIAEIYKISIPIFEKKKDYQTLSSSYKHLHHIYDKIVEVNISGKRLLGRFYRVAFFGEKYFKEDSSKEYIYKEPKVTSLPEISERLYFLFCKKFGKDVVKMIMDSVVIHQNDLDPRYAYIQVTHVMPYLEENLASTATEFEKNNNISEFVFETPFTLSGQKARGAIHEQCKKKTILTTQYSFPYVKKRIEVLLKKVITLKPIEVAIEEMETRTKELIEVTTLHPPDLKKLQLKLQGSISVQVNAGPLAYANAFLDERSLDPDSLDSVPKLKSVFRAFVHVCGAALELNERLIVPEQHQYHEALKENFQELVKSLSHILNEQF